MFPSFSWSISVVCPPTPPTPPQHPAGVWLSGLCPSVSSQLSMAGKPSGGFSRGGLKSHTISILSACTKSFKVEKYPALVRTTSSVSGSRNPPAPHKYSLYYMLLQENGTCPIFYTHVDSFKDVKNKLVYLQLLLQLCRKKKLQHDANHLPARRHVAAS